MEIYDATFRDKQDEVIHSVTFDSLDKMTLELSIIAIALEEITEMLYPQQPARIELSNGWNLGITTKKVRGQFKIDNKLPIEVIEALMS